MKPISLFILPMMFMVPSVSLIIIGIFSPFDTMSRVVWSLEGYFGLTISTISLSFAIKGEPKTIGQTGEPI